MRFSYEASRTFRGKIKLRRDRHGNNRGRNESRNEIGIGFFFDKIKFFVWEKCVR